MTEHRKPQVEIGELLRTISNPARVQILLAIGDGEACVCHLEALLGLRQANISQQLMALRDKNIITSRREGRYTYYRLLKPEVLDIVRAAGELVGVPHSALQIQDHSKCTCPKCSMQAEAASKALPKSGQV